MICAIIIADGKALACQRSSSMHCPLQWEFPGGKLHCGEAEEAGLKREIEEELGLQVTPWLRLQPCTFHYPAKHIELIPFACHVTGGSLHLHEHHAACWCTPENLRGLQWCAADVAIVAEVLQRWDELNEEAVG